MLAKNINLCVHHGYLNKMLIKVTTLGIFVFQEEKVEHNFQSLATLLGPLYKTLAPEAYGNQVSISGLCIDCLPC